MTRKYLTGFELNSNAGGMEVTAAGGSPTIQSTTVRSGTYALQITSLSSGTAKGFRVNFLSAAGNGPWYFRVYFRYATAPSGDNQIIQLNDTNAFTTPVAYIVLNASGALELWDEDGQIGSDSSALSANTWYRVELEFNRTGAAGAHVVRARIDGTEFAGAANRDLSAGILTFNFGGNLLLEAQTTGNWYFDDIAINDNTGSYQNSYPGEGELIIVRPSGAGASAAWTRGGADSGANWSQLEETPPNDVTDYVLSNTLDQIDFYALGNTPAALESSDVINCVMPGVRFAVDNATGSDPDITIGLTVSGNSDESAVIDVTSTSWRTNDNGGVLVNYPALGNDSNYEVPGTANAYTKSDLDSMEFRLRQAATDTHNALVTAVWVYVDHKPSSGLSATIGQVTETDTAQALTRVKQLSVSQVSETDAAQAMTRAKQLAVGQVSETDLAQAMTFRKEKLIGQASESDAAQALSASKVQSLGQASESDAAQALTTVRQLSVGQASETDSAQPVSSSGTTVISQVQETNLAQLFTTQKNKSIGQASESDAAQALTRVKVLLISQVSETDLAQGLFPLKRLSIAQVLEIDLAQALSERKLRVIGQASEIDLALAIEVGGAGTEFHRNRQLQPVFNSISPLGS